MAVIVLRFPSEEEIEVMVKGHPHRYATPIMDASPIKITPEPPIDEVPHYYVILWEWTGRLNDRLLPIYEQVGIEKASPPP